ncbi:surfeit locus protein 6-domain-containing protein [Chlamydoabsidia padenii]|nr:surfeit locus protein 6-domain-containing protein [Chlamydoabsidia padenii]
MVQTQILDSLSERISTHSTAFDALLNLIPSKFYFTDPKAAENDSKYMHNKRKSAPKQVVKEASKKAKKAKLDPSNQRTITEIQQEQQFNQQTNNGKANSKQQPKKTQAVISTSNNDGMDVDEDDQSKAINGQANFSGLVDDAEPAQLKPTEPLQPMPPKNEISELKRKLHDRIIQQREKRNAPGTGTNKTRSREAILEERLKKKQDRKKAIKSQKEKGNKVAPEELVKDPTKSSTRTGNAADSVKMDGDIVFGKLSVGPATKKKGAVDIKSQLKKIETQQQKLDKLKSEDKEKARALLEKQEWQKAIAMATGEKIKDDTTLLKKTIKRQEKIKNKSAQEWTKRAEKVKYDEQSKIKKRTENLQKRIDSKKDKKSGKKGGNKARAGFEGTSRIKGGKVTKPSPKSKGKKK